ncbi:2-oxo acid dehydrogenase subunit E2 [Rubrivirga marina]|uniref:2-oxoacid dehydrogenase acyltransferase catalytic domain-containing protein n=1 Tax=Rubrivirga marina TaxID=1196024 RepID=A0A271J5C7_9BACT|nr:2-oxo acid dehydrogenase subunit E2 [Rubrivirga marina]PAP78508.1 hypothetical protein BSZ37_19800 [Rubrivirga marina]
MHTTVPLSRLQVLNGRTMHEALQQSAQATLHTDADAGPLVAFRAAQPESDAVSVEAVVGRALVGALQAHPHVNARIGVEGLNVHRSVNLGLMVVLEKGVIVPVIAGAEGLPLRELDGAFRRMAARAEAGDLSLNDTRNTTFTLASFASFGVDHFTPILVGNMVATLGVGRVRAVCEPGDDGCRPGHRIALSLTFDHRAIHGVEAARFLQAVTDRLAAPDRL